MPITCIKVDLQDEAGGEIAWGDSVTGEATETYTVYLSGRTRDPSIAAFATTGAAGSVPAFGAALGPYILTKKRPTRTARASVWKVECTYTIPQPFQEPKPADEEINLWNVKFSGRSASYEVEVDRDKDKKPIVNCAGDDVGGVTTPRSDEEIEISFTAVMIPWTSIAACRDRVNNAPVTLKMNGQERTFAARTMWFRAWTWDYIRDANMATYPAVTYSLLIRPETWDKTITNKGYNYLATAGNLATKKPWLDAHGDKISQPGYLASDGTKLPPGTEATLQPWKVFDEADFTANLLANLES